VVSKEFTAFLRKEQMGRFRSFFRGVESRSSEAPYKHNAPTERTI
jgi:hypothetical protein